MALIYANAVNKRMHHGSKMKKRSTNSCPMHDDSPDNEYRRSSSKDAPTRKYSENSSYLSSSASSCHSLSPAVAKIDSKHRPVQRSKTSCGDLYLKKIVEDEAVRKSSHPVMSQSMLTCNRNKNCPESNTKRQISKKSLIQKYDLEQKVKIDELKNSIHHPVDRRRSASLDEEQWKHEHKKEDDGAFSKMKRKFSKMMFN